MEFSFLGESLRVQAGGSLALERILAATNPLSLVILGRGDDSMHPGTSLGADKAGMTDGLEDRDPTDLEDFFSQTVVAGDPLGEG